MCNSGSGFYDIFGILGGGGGTPGGLPGEVQFNDSGSFGGTSGAVADETTFTLVNGKLGGDLNGDGYNIYDILGLTVDATGEVSLDYATASTIAIIDASNNLISADTATYPSLTELSYVKGATSNIQLQINALSGALTYYGTWDASTNTPTLTSSVGITGQYYVVSVAGSTNLDGITTWNVGDWAIFNGSVWERLQNGSAVSSVSGTANRITSTGGATPVIDIAATYVGQSSITTLGTISTGTWSATNIALAKGGTGASLSDPGYNAVWVWDDTTNATRLAQLSGITYDSSTNTLTATGGGGGSGTVTSVGTGDYLTGGPITTSGTINVGDEIELSIVTSLLMLSGNL